MKREYFYKIMLLLPFLISLFTSCMEVQSPAEKKPADVVNQSAPESKEPVKVLDTAAYDKIMLALANGDTTGNWPVKAPYPLPGAILPFHRIVAFYGNLYSKRMGILGELPKNQMLSKLNGEVAKWQAADSSLLLFLHCTT
jgi:hypothetical protein